MMPSCYRCGNSYPDGTGIGGVCSVCLDREKLLEIEKERLRITKDSLKIQMVNEAKLERKIRDERKVHQKIREKLTNHVGKRGLGLFPIAVIALVVLAIGPINFIKYLYLVMYGLAQKLIYDISDLSGFLVNKVLGLLLSLNDYIVDLIGVSKDIPVLSLAFFFAAFLYTLPSAIRALKR